MHHYNAQAGSTESPTAPMPFRLTIVCVSTCCLHERVCSIPYQSERPNLSASYICRTSQNICVPLQTHASVQVTFLSWCSILSTLKHLKHSCFHKSIAIMHRYSPRGLPYCNEFLTFFLGQRNIHINFPHIVLYKFRGCGVIM